MPFKFDVYEPSAYREPAPIDRDSPFQSMMERFDVAAEILELSPGFYEYLCRPARMHATSIPVEMDTGRIKIYEGYRVIHNKYATAEEYDVSLRIAAYMVSVRRVAEALQMRGIYA